MLLRLQLCKACEPVEALNAAAGNRPAWDIQLMLHQTIADTINRWELIKNAAVGKAK